MYVSVSDEVGNAVGSFALKGYFQGKRDAEAAMKGTGSSVILAPTFIYGAWACSHQPARSSIGCSVTLHHHIRRQVATNSAPHHRAWQQDTAGSWKRFCPSGPSVPSPMRSREFWHWPCGPLSRWTRWRLQLLEQVCLLGRVSRDVVLLMYVCLLLRCREPSGTRPCLVGHRRACGRCEGWRTNLLCNSYSSGQGDGWAL